MKKNNGFTLIELLAVIVILGLIALIAIPTVLNKLKSTKEDLFNSQINLISAGVNSYVTDELVHTNITSPIYNLVHSHVSGTSEIRISLDELQRSGALDYNINNPLCDGDNIYFSPTDTMVKIIYDGKEFEYEVISNNGDLRNSCTEKVVY